MSISDREKALAVRNEQAAAFFTNNPEADAVRDWARSKLADKKELERKNFMFAQMPVSEMVKRRKAKFSHLCWID